MWVQHDRHWDMPSLISLLPITLLIAIYKLLQIILDIVLIVMFCPLGCHSMYS